MAVLWFLLAVGLLAQALRLRGRLGRLVVLDAPPAAAAQPGWRLVTAPRVGVSEPVRQAAAAHAAGARLEALDLWPPGLPADVWLGLAQLVDPDTFRRARLTRGWTAGHALLVRADLLERLDPAEVPGAPAPAPPDATAFLRLGLALKRYACTGYDVAIAPGLPAVSPPAAERRALLRAALGTAAVPILASRLGFVSLLVYGAFAAGWPGILALVAWQLGPALALAGLPGPRPPDLWLRVVLRPVLEAADILSALRAAPAAPVGAATDPVEARRPLYADLLAGGTARFFEPRRPDCPLCASTDLRVHIRTRDLFQRKPGTFTLERCRACGHVFQNPRLSLDGLSFYYRDFYDGLDAEALEAVLGAGPAPYEARLGMVRSAGVVPGAWLDVGGGNGHLCCLGRDVWPESRFDALDLSDGVDAAVRRRWVDRAWRGLFPDVAPQIAGAYDVVSMSHYLEHTTDPAAELAAARTALRPGGHLFIEVPDPDSRGARLLGRYWLPWFQPQHLHLVSTANLERLLRAQGFEPVVWHRSEAHYPVDLFLAGSMLVNQLAPPPARPWLPPPGPARRVAHRAAWVVAAPFLALAFVLDLALAPVLRRAGFANAYRVLARRLPGEAAD